MKFHHFGLAVKEFTYALKFFKKMGYECSEPIFDQLQEVELIMCKSDKEPCVELIKPVSIKSPINNYINKNNEIVYHFCYEIDDYKSIEEFFSEYNYKCISKPKPAILFNNGLVSFYYIKGLGLIEFLLNK
jgi:methylmalonyl-CoA/ethylmalonyl-CoA epimerase